MRILITNNKLNNRGGATLFIRSLARGLQSLGHSVMAYSSDPGERERLLEHDTIPVTTDIASLPFPPDVIHAQHHLDAMTAITALPGVPAIYHCHGALWRDCVPKHPRIYRYLAMSRTLAERIAVESNIAPDEIEVVLNGVELARFGTVRELPERPLRALIYNKTHEEGDDTVTAIREAAGRCGVELDCIGRSFSKAIFDPEKVLPTYDVVFASGMSAIDALACGCAVIILGRTSCGAMVRMENFERFRQVNFSIAVNSAPPSTDAIERELRSFDAKDARLVTDYLRRVGDFSLVVENLVKAYELAIQQHENTETNLPAEIAATSQYLRRIVPLIKMTDDAQLSEGMTARRATQFIDLRVQLSRIEAGLKDVY